MAKTSNNNGSARVLVYGSLVVVVALAVLGVVFSPENTISILGFCTLAITGLFTHLSSLRTSEQQSEKLDTVAEKAEVAAAKVEEVKTALGEKDTSTTIVLNEIVKTGEQNVTMGKRNHQLLNSGHGLILKSNAELARWKADKENTPEYIAAAELAEKQYRDHEAKQNSLDISDAEDAKQKENP
jgi:hypothetical protein